MALNSYRRKILEQTLPEGVMVNRKWLMQHLSLNNHAIDNLVKSEQLKLLHKGIYMRGSLKLLSWQSIIFSLQTLMKTDYVIGGLTALSLKGFAHYLPLSGSEAIHLYGKDKFPTWINELPVGTEFIRHSERAVFKNILPPAVEDFIITIPWNDRELKISCPEKACLEMLNEVPANLSFEHADQLIQGMTSLSPRLLQRLLEQCTSVKVKRLFLWFASQYNYNWFSKVNSKKIYLGSGNRSVVKEGELDKTYKITVPKNSRNK